MNGPLGLTQRWLVVSTSSLFGTKSAENYFKRDDFK